MVQSNPLKIGRAAKLFFSIVLLFISAFACDRETNERRKSNVKIMENPVVVIDVEVSGAAFEVRFNDVPVVTDRVGGQFAVEQAVTGWAISGRNELAVSLLPSHGQEEIDETVVARFSLYVREANQRTTMTKVSEISFNRGVAVGSEKGRYLINIGDGVIRSDEGLINIGMLESEIFENEKEQPEVKLKQSVDIPLKLPSWAWITSEPMQDSPVLRDQLFGAYQKIYGTLKQRNYRSLSSWFEEQFRESDQYNYKRDGTTRDFTIDSWRDELEGGEYEIFPLERDNVDFHLYANGRVAEFRHWDNGGPIIFNRIDGSASASYKAVFRRDGESFSITR